MNVIPNNIQAKEFRYHAECRDQLQHKGDLYVGTGITEEVTLDDKTTKSMWKTEPLYRTTDGSAPASDDSNQPTNGMALLIDNSNSKGWKIGKVGPEGLDRRYYVYNEQINFAAGIRGTLNGITWSQTINPNEPSSSLKLMPTKITSLNTSKTLVLPFEDGTLATKEQIESGEIVAKTAQYASADTSKGTIEERLGNIYISNRLREGKLGETVLDGVGPLYVQAAGYPVGTLAIPNAILVKTSEDTYTQSIYLATNDNVSTANTFTLFPVLWSWDSDGLIHLFETANIITNTTEQKVRNPAGFYSIVNATGSFYYAYL